MSSGQQKMIRCCECGEIKNDEKELECHLLRTHLKWYPYRCYWCVKDKKETRKATEDQLQSHIQLYHPGMPPKRVGVIERTKLKQLQDLIADSKAGKLRNKSVSLQNPPSSSLMPNVVSTPTVKSEQTHQPNACQRDALSVTVTSTGCSSNTGFDNPSTSTTPSIPTSPNDRDACAICVAMGIPVQYNDNKINHIKLHFKAENRVEFENLEDLTVQLQLKYVEMIGRCFPLIDRVELIENELIPEPEEDVQMDDNTNESTRNSFVISPCEENDSPSIDTTGQIPEGTDPPSTSNQIPEVPAHNFETPENGLDPPVSEGNVESPANTPTITPPSTRKRGRPQKTEQEQPKNSPKTPKLNRHARKCKKPQRPESNASASNNSAEVIQIEDEEEYSDIGQATSQDNTPTKQGGSTNRPRRSTRGKGCEAKASTSKAGENEDSKFYCKRCKLKGKKWKSHIYESHLKMLVIKCPYCKFGSYYKKQSVVDHVKNKHPQERQTVIDERNKQEHLKEVFKMKAECFGIGDATVVDLS